MIIQRLIQRAKEMFLGRFFTRAGHSISTSTTEQGSPSGTISASSEEQTVQVQLEASKNLTTSNSINKALDDVEKAIQSEGPTNQLLLKKSEILLRKCKFRQARQILKDISKDKKDSKASRQAKQLLKNSFLLQQETDNNKLKELVNQLHQTAQRYGNKLINLPSAEDLPSGVDITLIVREEARLARSAELPKLSLELIGQTLQSGQESLWLIHDKALSLSMMGQQSTALDILKELKQTTTREKLTNSINKNIEYINKNPELLEAKLRPYLATQTRIFAQNIGVDASFIPERSKFDSKIKVKFLIFRKARALLTDKPKATLCLVNSILDFFPNDLSALLLKGEALAALKQSDEAIKIWKDLVHSENKLISKKASELATNKLMKDVRTISAKKTPSETFSFLIQQHFKYNLAPKLSDEVKQYLEKIESPSSDVVEPELRQHQLQLLFNTLVVECLETQWRQQGRLNPNPAAQQPGAISKTAPKAG